MVFQCLLSLSFLVLLLPYSEAASQHDCDFSSDLCGYKVVSSSNKWQIYDSSSTQNQMKTYSDRSSTVMQGSFLYIAFVDLYRGGANTNTQLKGPSDTSSGKRCLSFKYRMFGPHPGKFKVSLKSAGSNSETVLLEKTGNQGKDWQDATLFVNWGVSQRLFFTAYHRDDKVEADSHGELALDDIQVSRGECPKKQSNSCSFDVWTCGWGDFNRKWQYVDKATASSVGPQTDFTTGGSGGYGLLVLEGDLKSRYTLSPEKKLIPKGHHKCFRFRYWLGDGAVLQAGIRIKNKSWTREFLWKSQNKDPREKWLLGETSVYSDIAEYQLVLEASKLSEVGQTFVAIDDLRVSDYDCPLRGNNYFEDGFDLYYNADDSDFDWLVTSSDTFGDVGIVDHTYETKSGHYALAYFQGDKEGNQAWLISPIFYRGEVSCLEFSFHVSSQGAGTLAVRVSGEDEIFFLGSTKTRQTDSGDWHSVILPLNIDEDFFQILFEATVGSAGNGYIALDDIIVSDTSCIAKSHQINWNYAGSTHSSSPFDCSFEEMTLCEWEQMAGSDFDLKVSQIGVELNDWDPKTNHDGQGKGGVLGTDTVMREVGRGGVTSPQIPGSNKGHCLSFWYWLHGRGVSLQVFIVGQGRTLFWQRLLDKGRGWQWAEINASDENEIQYNIRVEKLSSEGSVQIDDLWYSPNACEARQLSLTSTCDLETGLCGLTEPSISNNSWILVSGDWSDAVTWDQGDYSYKTSQGHFLLYSQEETVPGSTAILQSPVISLKADSKSSLQTCVHFQYFLSGPDVGTLEIATGSTHAYENVVWKTSGDHGPRWNPGEIQLGLQLSHEIKFELKAIAGNGPNGLFGIDDIAVRQGMCASQGSCGFDNGDFCTWRPGLSNTSNPWRVFQENTLNFKGDKQETAILISEQFSGGQVRCIHFVYAHVGNGKGSLELARRDIVLIESNQLLWKLIMDDRGETLDNFTWRPARVSVEAEMNHEIYITAEALGEDFNVLIDNILVTNQPCKSEPAEAVSFNCDFSDGLCYWYQESSNQAYWVLDSDTFKSGPKNFVQVAPGFMIQNVVSRLHSPLIPAGNRCLRFSYFLDGADVGYLKVFMDIGYIRLPYVEWRGASEKQTWEQAVVNLKNDQNYRLEIEGLCLEPVSCTIAIANIEVSDYSCPDTWHSGSDSPHCTFESDSDPLCQFTVRTSQDSESFKWKREGGLRKFDPKAPNLDFTLGASGYYAYVAAPTVEFDRQLTNVSTRLTSPTLHSRKDAPYCMIFAYYLEGSWSSELSVYQVVPGEDPNTPLFHVDVSEGSWERAFVTLEKLDAFQIIFEARADESTTGSLAVDEIFLKKGPCTDWSDVCSFTEDLCLWINVVDGTDSIDWERHSRELSVDDGPISDHTQLDPDGHYVMAGRMSGNIGDNARLLSEMHFPASDVTDMCVDFVYFMSEKGSVLLKVNLVTGFETAFTPTRLSVWSLETLQTQRGQWLRARVPVDKRYTSKLLKIEFEVVLKGGGAAIDDVHIQSTKCAVFPKEAKALESVLDLASCSFDENSLCGWHNSRSDSPQWVLQSWSEVDRRIPRRFADETDAGGSLVYINTVTGATDQPKSLLTSPLLLPTDGVNCLRFWFYTDFSVVDTLRLSMNINDTNVLLWHGDIANTWRIVYVNMHSEESFQLSFEAELGAHAIEDIFMTPGLCPRTDSCRFASGWCGYTQDTSDDFDWEITTTTPLYARSFYGIKPNVQGHTGEEKARLMSPLYAGGGPQCFEFSIHRPAPLSGQLFVYAQELNSPDLGEKLWEMPYVKTLDVTLKRLVQVPVHKAKPFRLVLEFKVGVANGNSPTLDDLRLLSHPCQPLGSCDFEDGLCTYIAIESNERHWARETPYHWNSKNKPPIDHTFLSPVGYYMASTFKSSKNGGLDLQSTIFPRTSDSCLTFAYSLLTSVHLQVVLNVDDTEPKILLDLTDSFDKEHLMDWKETQVNLQADRHFILIFRSFSEVNDSTDYVTASLDDIKLVPGPCGRHMTTTPATFQAEYYLLTDLSCTFESTSRPFCQYNPGSQSNGYWRRTYGSYNSSGLGFDHTRGDSKGVYASVVSISEAEPAVASLEVITTLNEASHCLSFWYHIAGNSANKLSVYYTTDGSPLWVKSNEQDMVWQHAQIRVDPPVQDSSDESSHDQLSFYSIKFQGILLEKEGHVALDDIEVFRGSCPSDKKDTGVCEFEQDGLCEYTQDSHDANHWERKQAGKILTSDGSILSEPFFQVDHSYGTEKGHYMFCCAAHGYEGSTSSMVSPVYKANPDGRCLVFWYKRRRGDLIILVRDREGHTVELGDIHIKNEAWEIQHYNVRSRSDFQIIFQAKRTVLYLSAPAVEVILDDIQVAPGPCQELYSCDFSRDLCSWTQNIQGSAEWRITSGIPPPGQQLIGPDRDHSTMSSAGQYIILQGSMHGDYADVTILTSQIIFLPGNDEKGQVLCFSFWYHMSDTSAGSITVSASGTSHTWGPFNHEESGWVHEMMSVPLMKNSDNLQISLVATVAPGRQNYIALDDLELEGHSCQKVEHTQELSCKDGANTKVSYEKVCDFVSDCDNGQDEKDCSECGFEYSWCRFVSIMDDQFGWRRMAANSDSVLAPKANGYFLGAGEAEYVSGTFETATTFKRSSPSCRMQFRLNIIGDVAEAPTFTIKARTHYDTFNIVKFLSPSNRWTLADVLIGNIDVPFQLVFKSWTNRDTDAIGFDDFRMIGCAFPEPQAACSNEEFRCDNQACVAMYTVCDFADDCGDFSDEKDCGNIIRNDFNVNFGDWIRVVGSKDNWILDNPHWDKLTADHTPGSGGMCIKTDHQSQNGFDQNGQSSARIEGPVIAATDSNTEACQLSFFFAIANNWDQQLGTQNTDDQAINVYIKSVGSDQLRQIPFTTQQLGQWTRAVAPISESLDFQVIIEGVTTEVMYENGAFIALDDISFSPSCQRSTKPLPSCSNNEFRCANQECIERYKVCDFTSDCSDLSDEKDCDMKLNTDFQNGHGGWDYSPRVGGDAWLLQSSSTKSQPKDHTPDVYKKQYSVAGHWGPWQSKAEKHNGKLISLAFMSSPVLQPTDSNQEVCQFGFFYWIRDTELYSINVYTKPVNSGQLKQISYSSLTEGQWTRAVADLSESADFQIVLEAVNLEPLDSGSTNVAVDDIYFTSFCHRKEGATKPVQLDIKTSAIHHESKVQATTKSDITTSNPTTLSDESTIPIDKTTTSADDLMTQTSKRTDFIDTFSKNTKHKPQTFKSSIEPTEYHQPLKDIEPFKDIKTPKEPFFGQTTQDPLQYHRTDDKNDHASGSSEFQKKEKRQEKKNVKIWVGVSVGLIALGLGVLVATFLIRRYRPTLYRFSRHHDQRDVGFANQAYNEHALEEAPDVNYGSAGQGPRVKPRSRSIENPVYLEDSTA